MCPCVIGENATCCGSGGNRVTGMVDADKEFVSRSSSSSAFTVTTCRGCFLVSWQNQAVLALNQMMVDKASCGRIGVPRCEI